MPSKTYLAKIIRKIARRLVFLSAAFALFAAMPNTTLGYQEPVIKNPVPSGNISANNVTLSVGTADLARCRYHSSDTSYDNMDGVMTTPDGLLHSVSLGTLGNGSYTYYVRCKDFADVANTSSVKIQFTVGGGSPVAGLGPVLSGLKPSGNIYTPNPVISAVTDRAASCRYSWYNKTYDAMTLPFGTTDHTHHSAQINLGGYGYNTLYVRCIDDSGNTNQNPRKNNFPVCLCGSVRSWRGGNRQNFSFHIRIGPVRKCVYDHGYADCLDR